MKRRVWFERSFPPGLPLDALPDVLERLRGTPARLEERVRALSAGQRRTRLPGGWSVQEHVGHLGDLEPLWAGRVADLVAGEEMLRPADLENRATDEARHGDSEMTALLRRFRDRREDLVARLEGLDDDVLTRTALHPRLRQPMSAVDLCFFVAEHDDHHLAAITELLRVSGVPAGS